MGMTSPMWNSKLRNFIISRKLIKTPQNFAEVPLSIKLKKICKQKQKQTKMTGIKFSPHFPFKKYNQ